MIRVVLLSLVTLALAALPSRLRASGDEAHVQLTRRGALDGRQPAVETYEVTSPMKRLEVHVALRLKDGEADWELRDPKGEVRWRGTAAAGEPEEEEEQVFPAVAGEWRLTIRPSGAEGSYALRWRGDS